MPLSLEVAPHHAEDQIRAAVLRYHRRDDRVERPLVRLQAIEVILVERKQIAAVLQDETEVTRDELAAEAVVVALDERDTIAVLVHRTQVNRVAGAEFRGARGVVG